MGSVFRRYPNLNRGLVLLVTLVLPPATAAAVLHALSQERPALVAPLSVEARPAQERTVQAAEEQADDETIEPAAPEIAPPGGGESQARCERSASEVVLPEAASALASSAPLSSLAPRAPPA